MSGSYSPLPRPLLAETRQLATELRATGEFALDLAGRLETVADAARPGDVARALLDLPDLAGLDRFRGVIGPTGYQTLDTLVRVAHDLHPPA